MHSQYCLLTHIFRLKWFKVKLRGNPPASWHHQLHFDFVGHDDAEDLPVGSFSQASQESKHAVRHQQPPLQLTVKAPRVWRDSQSAGGQVGVFVLQFSVQGEAALFPVVGQEWSEGENFAERWAGSHNVTEDTKTELLLSPNVLPCWPKL